MHPASMAVTVVPRLSWPWCLTHGSWRRCYINQPARWVTVDKWILHQETSAPSGHCELVKVKQVPPEARLRQLYPSKGKCASGCTISLLLAFQSNPDPESPWTVTKGKDHFVVFPVAPSRPCCAHTRQSKRPLSIQIVHSRICNNLLSSLFICVRQRY